VLILARKSLSATFSFVQLPTHMARRLLLAELSLPGTTERAMVGTVHLESLASGRTRQEQLRICAAQLAPYANAVLCGDFNICSYRSFGVPEGTLEVETCSLSNRI
jgi:endonuclease/exonuclease/phosphatase family metal-dependent hydrolase